MQMYVPWEKTRAKRDECLIDRIRCSHRFSRGNTSQRRRGGRVGRWVDDARSLEVPGSNPRRGSRILKWRVNFLHLNQRNQRNQRNQILFQYLRDKKKRKKERGSEKGGEGENSPISPPLDPRLNPSPCRYLDLFSAPISTPRPRCVNCQLISPQLVGIANCSIWNIRSFNSSVLN